MANIETIQVGEDIYGIGGQTIQVKVMPIASDDYVDEIYQYVGDTDDNFTNGYFYKCVEDPDNEGEYIWIQSYTQGNIDLMPAEDMPEIVNPLPSINVKRTKYSTEEQIIGEWIDGKPIYQKTIIDIIAPICVQDGTAVTKDIDVSDLDIDTFIKDESNIIVPYQGTYSSSVTLPGISGGNTICLWYKPNTKKIRTSNASTTYNEAPMRITLQYTKTTDTSTT